MRITRQRRDTGYCIELPYGPLFQPGELAMTDSNAFDRASPAEDPTWKASWETEENYWYENFTSRP